jgi:hypothetical protein
MHKPNPAAGEHILPMFGECVVIRVSQSPFDRMRWMLTLKCGHEVWLKQASRPSFHRYQCAKCATASGAPMGKGAK